MRGLTVVLGLVVAVAPAPNSVRYDQSQTGDYNIHLDLKNIDILAILDESLFSPAQYDDYDYADLTLKPPPSPNKTDTTGSVPAIEGSSTPGAGNTTEVEGQVGSESNNSTSSESPTTVGLLPAASRPARRCGAGFYRDNFGKCRRLKRPTHSQISSLVQKVQNKVKLPNQ